MRRAWLAAVAALLVCGQAVAVTRIVIDSDAGDAIGAGRHFELDSDNGTFTFNISTTKLFIRHLAPDGSFFDFEFTPPRGELLGQAPFLGAVHVDRAALFQPGMAVTRNGGDCATIDGKFLIHEFDLTGTNPRIALDFEQFCDSATDRLSGTIRINSEVPAPYTLPVAWAGADLEAPEGAALILDGSGSYASAGAIVAYQWRQIAGSDAIVGATDEALLEIETPPLVALGGEQLIFELTVTDSAGQSASDRITVTTRNKSDPQTYAELASDAGDPLGQGGSWSFDLTNARFEMVPNLDGGVAVTITGASVWVINLAAPGGARLEAGEYVDATQYPFQEADAPGLDVAGAGRTCSQVQGSFRVDRIRWRNDRPVSLLATFEQRCEGATPALRGRISIDAPHPSVPHADAGDNITQPETRAVNLDGSASRDDDGVIVAYRWRQVSGPEVRLENGDGARPSFIVEALPDGARFQRYVFELLVEDDLGYQASDRVSVTLTQDNRPPEARDDEFTVTAAEGSLFDPLENDGDLDGTLDPASIELIDHPGLGTVTINDDGTLFYQPGEAFLEDPEATDTFTYTVRDNDGAAAEPPATVTVYYDEIAAKGGPFSLYNGPEPGGGGALAPWWAALAIPLLRRRERE